MYKKVEESQTLLINSHSKKLASQNKRIIKLGFGQSPFLPPSWVIKGLQDHAERKEYTSVQGDEQLLINISKFHKDHSGLEVAPDNILTAPGSKILIFNILLAFEKADVFIPAPSWVSYSPQAKLTGHNIIKLPCSFRDKWRINSKTIIEASAQKINAASILILNYPGNPDGLSYTKEELEDIATAARSLNMLVISDEIYALLSHQKEHVSFACIYPERTITTTGLSKWCGAGGWRFGAALLHNKIEEDFKKALIGIASETYSCAPAPIQAAATIAYNSFETIQPYLDKQIKILKTIGNYCASTLNEHRIRVHPPEGGFYLFPDFSEFREKLNLRGIWTSAQMAEVLLNETGVATLPASAFGFNQEQLSLRIAYVDFIEPSDDKSIDIRRDFPKVVEGIDLICQWVGK